MKEARVKRWSPWAKTLFRAVLCATALAPLLTHGAEYIRVAPRDGDYLRLVPSNPVPAPSAPIAPPHLGFRGAIIDILSMAGPMFNDVMVGQQLSKNFQDALNAGLQEAEKFGQQGLLIKVQIVSIPVAGGRFLKLRGKGAALVGVGPNADAVCFAARCYSTVEEKIPDGAGLTERSGYIWVEAEKEEGIFAATRYRIDTLEDRSRQIRLNEFVRSAYRSAVVATAIDGYAKRLAVRASDSTIKTAVMALIQSRIEARSRLEVIERDLMKGLRRARRAARASATLSQISGALSLASTIALANASLGEDVEKIAGGPMTSKADVAKAVMSIETTTGQKVRSLSVEQQTIRSSIGEWESRILQIGVELDVVPDGGSVLVPLP